MTSDRAALIRERFGLPVASIEPIGEGWDSDTYEVDSRWIFRFPRRPAVARRMAAEIELLPTIRDRLPAPVPRIDFISDDPLFVGYRKLDGRPARPNPPPRIARSLGRFLAALHAVPLTGLPVEGTADDWRVELGGEVDDFAARVVPLLDPYERAPARSFLDHYMKNDENFCFRPALVHADLGPEHVLTNGDSLTGVIDWSDARVGDPAIDLAWPLHGPDARFARELLKHYGSSDETLCRRALFYHRLGPWHEVTYGLDVAGEAFVASGLRGIRERGFGQFVGASGPRRKTRPGTGR